MPSDLCNYTIIPHSAGVGRTGAFVTIDNVLQEIHKENVVGIAGTVAKIREQRMKLVQTVVRQLPTLMYTVLQVDTHSTNAVLVYSVNLYTPGIVDCLTTCIYTCIYSNVLFIYIYTYRNSIYSSMMLS